VIDSGGNVIAQIANVVSQSLKESIAQSSKENCCLTVLKQEDLEKEKERIRWCFREKIDRSLLSCWPRDKRPCIVATQFRLRLVTPK